MGSPLGERITSFRKKIGLSQKNLAAAAGISPTALNYYEKGKCEPNILVLMNLAKALNVTGDALLGLEPHQDLIAQNRDEYNILRDFRNLNALGQQRLSEYAAGLGEVPRFTRLGEVII
jgi:transcriptional regulator with XRE-family HTH domain